MRIVSHKGIASERAADSDYASALSPQYMQEYKDQLRREDEELQRLLEERGKEGKAAA